MSSRYGLANLGSVVRLIKHWILIFHAHVDAVRFVWINFDLNVGAVEVLAEDGNRLSLLVASAVISR